MCSLVVGVHMCYPSNRRDHVPRPMTDIHHIENEDEEQIISGSVKWSGRKRTKTMMNEIYLEKQEESQVRAQDRNDDQREKSSTGSASCDAAH